MLNYTNYQDIEKALKKEKYDLLYDISTLQPAIRHRNHPQWIKHFDMRQLLESNNTVEEGIQYLKELYNNK